MRRDCSVFRWLTFIAVKETQEEFRNANSFAGHFHRARDGIHLLPGCVCSRQTAIQTGEDSHSGPTPDFSGVWMADRPPATGLLYWVYEFNVEEPP